MRASGDEPPRVYGVARGLEVAIGTLRGHDIIIVRQLLLYR